MDLSYFHVCKEFPTVLISNQEASIPQGKTRHRLLISTSMFFQYLTAPPLFIQTSLKKTLKVFAGSYQLVAVCLSHH